MSGPPPAPTALRRLRGNPGKRRLNDAEPAPAPTDATPPADAPLTGYALAFWHRHAPELVRLGILTAVDKDEFALGCRVRAQGLAHLDDARSTTITDLALKELAMSSRIFARYGIGASDRSRITSAVPKKPASKWAGILGGKSA